jgi:hypothetical protein
MEAFKISVKIFTASDGFAPSEFVPVFQRWIQTHALADHLLIDVADYAHVHNGPGSVLVTSQANLYTDRADGRLGLIYSRKLPMEGSFGDRLLNVTASTLRAASLLENDPAVGGRLKFRTDELLIRLNDRLFAPNTAQTYENVLGDLKALANRLYGPENVSYEHKPSSLSLFEVRMKAQKSPSIQTILEKLG